MERLMSSTMVARVVEVSVIVAKSFACLLLIMGAAPNGILECCKEPWQLERLPTTDHMEKQPVPENTDATGTKEDEKDNDKRKDAEGDDAGEKGEDFPGEADDDGVEDDDDPQVNGDGESDDDNDDDYEDEDDDDDEDDDGYDEDEELEEDDTDIPHPPAKRRK